MRPQIAQAPGCGHLPRRCYDKAAAEIEAMPEEIAAIAAGGTEALEALPVSAGGWLAQSSRC